MKYCLGPVCASCCYDVEDGEAVCISCDPDDQSAGLRTLARNRKRALNWPGKLVATIEPPSSYYHHFQAQVVVPIPLSASVFELESPSHEICARRIILEGRKWTSADGRVAYVYAWSNAYFASFTEMMREVGVVGSFRY